jgi:UDP-GlcNAc:undecaprenyl-phosphate GlcNAc-1-phosphate transferase
MAVRDVAILAGTGLLLGGVAFALGAAVCGRVARGSSFGLVDFPGGPLRHRVAVPLGGGLVIWLSTVAVLGLGALAAQLGRPFLPGALARHVDGLWYRSGELALILGLATAVMIIGLVYDLFETGWWFTEWWFRLGALVALAALLAASGCRVTLFWPLSHPAVGGLITVLWVVGLTNAFTFLDNMDGLAAGVGLIASLLFAAAQAQMGSLFAPAVLLVLAGSLGGFLIYNRYPARVFLGDSGSGFIGFLLGAMTVAGTYFRYGRDDSPYGVLAPLLVMAVPLYESAWVFLFWLREHNDPSLRNRHDEFLRHRRHFSYRLLESGLTPPQAVRVVLLVSLGAGLGAPLLHRLDALGTLLVVGQSACLIGVLAILEAASIQRSRAR